MTFEIIFVLLALLGMVIALVLDKMRPGLQTFGFYSSQRSVVGRVDGESRSFAD